MIRGVSWPPATWIATSSEPNVNTRNDRASVMTVWYSACAPDRASAVSSQSSQRSSQRRIGAMPNTNAMAMSGTVQSADLR